ncbi:MAG: hypothetical protein ACRC45_03600 [Cetobacterium sp.]
MNEFISDYLIGDDSKAGVCTNAVVYGMENALRVSGFPMQTKDTIEATHNMIRRGSHLGKTKVGEGHDNYLLGVVVQFDLSFTNKAWVEFQRYHFADIISCQSTMHRIMKFDTKSSYCKYVRKEALELLETIKTEYNEIVNKISYANENPEFVTKKQIENYKEDLKEKYLEMLYTNPAGMILKAGITTNYRQLKTMVIQRYNHRLPEWREFTDWCFTLPLFEKLTGLNKTDYTV